MRLTSIMIGVRLRYPAAQDLGIRHRLQDVKRCNGFQTHPFVEGIEEREPSVLSSDPGSGFDSDRMSLKRRHHPLR